jgi:hypothetical protein
MNECLNFRQRCALHEWAKGALMNILNHGANIQTLDNTVKHFKKNFVKKKGNYSARRRTD